MENKKKNVRMSDIVDVLEKKGYGAKLRYIWINVSDNDAHTISEYISETIPDQWIVTASGNECECSISLRYTHHAEDIIDMINDLYQWAINIDTADSVLKQCSKGGRKMKNEKCITMVDVVEILQKKGYEAGCYNTRINIGHTQCNVLDYVKETLPFQWEAGAAKYGDHDHSFDISLKQQYLLEEDHDNEIKDLYTWALEIVCAENVPAANRVFDGPAIWPPYNSFDTFGGLWYSNNHITDSQFPEYVNPFDVFTPLGQRNCTATKIASIYYRR